MGTFHQAQACAGGAPAIISADEEEENLAHRPIHEGAEDVLLKSELECGPLARSVRYAIERRRRNQANQISPLADSGTGVLKLPGVHHGGLSLYESGGVTESGSSPGHTRDPRDPRGNLRKIARHPRFS